MIRALTITAAIIAASTLPALAIDTDTGVNSVMATVEMRVAAVHCGLTAPRDFQLRVISQALDFTGMTSDKYTISMVLAADKKSADLYQSGSMPAFCQMVRDIYAEQMK